MMLFPVIVAKALVELSLMFILGRLALGCLAGSARTNNVVWQLLDVAARPALWLTRCAMPQALPDRHIPWAAVVWLLVAWLAAVGLKIGWCLRSVVNVCT